MAPATATATKRCPGFASGGMPPHELAATLENFYSNKGNKDGLATRCRVCGAAYGKAWAAAKKAGVPFSSKANAPLVALPAGALEAPEDAALADAGIALSNAAAEKVRAEEPPPATLHVARPAGTPQYADELAVKAGRGRAQGYTTETVGGLIYALPESQEAVSSDEGQAALELVNSARAADRRRRDADRKRQERARAKARQQEETAKA